MQKKKETQVTCLIQNGGRQITQLPALTLEIIRLLSEGEEQLLTMQSGRG